MIDVLKKLPNIAFQNPASLGTILAYYIQKAIGRVDLLKFFLQISWEINSLEDKKYIIISEPLTEVGRMLGGWYRQLKK